VICQELLTRNKTASAEFLEANYDKFFSHYQNLLSSDNYVTRRQALKVKMSFELTRALSVIVAGTGYSLSTSCRKCLDNWTLLIDAR